MKEPRITIIRDDGMGDLNPSFAIDRTTWRLERDGLEGFDGVPYTVSVQDYAQYDGAYLMSERSGTRDRTIQAVALGDIAALRAQAESFFIPRREYEVHVEAAGRQRWFRARQYAFSLSVDNLRRIQRLTWTCLALDPMLLSEDEKRFDLAEASGYRGFPFLSFTGAEAPVPEANAAWASSGQAVHIAGFVVGVLSNEIPMVNGGDAPAYPRFDITATGDVVNPSIEIVDSRGTVVSRFGVRLTLRAGETLVVDFSARPTTVELNGENALNRVTAGSTLATGIDVGSFAVRWAADSGDASLHIEPTIRERYTTI